MVRLTTHLVIFALLSPLLVAGDACRFEDSAKGVIDLTSLGHTDGTAAFSEKDPPSPPPSDYSMQLSFVFIMIGE